MTNRKTDKPVIHYNDNAEVRTVTGWCCKTCNRYWGDEHMARYCCCTVRPCESCGGDCEKSYIKCKTCREKAAWEKWFAKPAVPWDGAFPIGIWGDDKYFFDADELIDYIAEIEAEIIDEAGEPLLGGVKFTTCRKLVPPDFSVNEFCCDTLAEDQEFADAKEIDETVNRLIQEGHPASFEMTGVRLNTADIVRWYKESQA